MSGPVNSTRVCWDKEAFETWRQMKDGVPAGWSLDNQSLPTEDSREYIVEKCVGMDRLLLKDVRASSNPANSSVMSIMAGDIAASAFSSANPRQGFLFGAAEDVAGFFNRNVRVIEKSDQGLITTHTIVLETLFEQRDYFEGALAKETDSAKKQSLQGALDIIDAQIARVISVANSVTVTLHASAVREFFHGEAEFGAMQEMGAMAIIYGLAPPVVNKDEDNEIKLPVAAVEASMALYMGQGGNIDFAKAIIAFSHFNHAIAIIESIKSRDDKTPIEAEAQAIGSHLEGAIRQMEFVNIANLDLRQRALVEEFSIRLNQILRGMQAFAAAAPAPAAQAPVAAAPAAAPPARPAPAPAPARPAPARPAPARPRCNLTPQQVLQLPSADMTRYFETCK